MFFWNYTMIILLPAMILAIYAQAKVTTTFEKYLKVPAKSGMTGADVARQILNQSGIYDVSVQIQGGRLSDHYDPRRKVLKLSSDVYNGRSRRLGVAAHECGHAIQHDVDMHCWPCEMPLFRSRYRITNGLSLYFMGLV